MLQGAGAVQASRKSEARKSAKSKPHTSRASLGRVSLAMATQIFQNSFNGDLAAIKTALMSGHNLLVSLDSAKKVMARVPKLFR